MKTFTKILTFKTKQFLDIIDITDKVVKLIKKTDMKNGLVNVFCRHTTATIKINENEKGFFKDLKRFCEKFVPSENDYQHNELHKREAHTICTNREECLNGHSHILQMFVGTASETVPLVEGELMLGTWQKLLLVDLDGGRERNVVVQVLY